jgi:GH35 family endo-1,4-beta-xylanase
MTAAIPSPESAKEPLIMKAGNTTLKSTITQFFATFHHQMIEEMADYENWFDVFNFGVARNAMKWKQQEKQPGVIDWTKSDDINDIFFQARMKIIYSLFYFYHNRNINRDLFTS